MANALYPLFKQACLSGGVDFSGSPSDVVKFVFVNLTGSPGYTYSAAHEFLDDIPAGARVATSDALANKSVTTGIFNADDNTVSTVSGDNIEAIIIFIDTGNEATSRLVAYIDTNYTGLPCTPNGGDIKVQWPNDANKIFSL